jgi:hypothetical protein
MSQLATSRPATPGAGSGAPAAVWSATVITALLTVVTSYGAVYFSFFFEDPEPGLGSWAFVTVFIAINITAATAAARLVRGNATARRVLVGYGVLGVLWCIAKLVFWSETEALVFGAANVLLLGLLFMPKVRSYVA